MAAPVVALVVVDWDDERLEYAEARGVHESCAETWGELEGARLRQKYQRFVERNGAELAIRWGIVRT